MSSETQDYEGDLIDLHVRSPVLPRASPNAQAFTETSDNLIDTELPVLEQKLQVANQIITPTVDSRRTSVDVEDILITIDDDDEIDAPQKISDNFLDLCDVNLVDNLEALSVLRNLDDILNASLQESDTSAKEDGEELQEDIEDCLKDLDNYLKALDTSSSEDCSYTSNDSCSACVEDQSETSSSDQIGSRAEADVLGSTDEESLRNKLRQMEENYTKFLASGCVNRGYVDTEAIDGDRRPLSACGMTSGALNRNQPSRATVAVVRRERPSLQAVIASSSTDLPSRCAPADRTSTPGGDSDDDIDWSWLQDVARDVTLERRAHAAGDCCTGTVVVEAPRPAKPGSSSAPAMHEEPKEDSRGTWLRSSMRRLRHLRLPSDGPQPEQPRPEHVQLQTATAMRPVSAPSRLPAAARVSTRSSRSRSRDSAVSHEPNGRARSSSASSRSRRPRSLSSSDSSLVSSVDSTPSCSPTASPTQNAQEQQNGTAAARRYSFLVAGIIYGASKLKALQVIEEGKKEERERKKLERENRMAAERKAASDRDIAQIVAIFQGTTETDPNVSVEKTFSPKPLEPEDLKHNVKGDVNHTLNPGEVKFKVNGNENEKLDTEEIIHKTKDDTPEISVNALSEINGGNSMPSVTSTTEPSSTEQCLNDSPSVQDQNERDIFSNVFNLNTTSPKTGDISDTKNESGVNKTAEMEDLNKQLEQHGYIVESFKDKVPFAEAESFKSEFHGAENK